MIVGSGLLATAFLRRYHKCKKNIIFASGVSNSKETNENLFKKEFDLVKETIKKHPEKNFVYFSTTSMYTTSNYYTAHKRSVEEYITKNSNRYYIFRLPQVVGKLGNPNNLVSFFVQKIENNFPIQVANVNRSLIDVNDVHKLVDYILKTCEENQIFDISHVEIKKVSEIVDIIQDLLGKHTLISEVKSEDECYSINSEKIEQAIQLLNIRSKNYTKKILKKYVEYYRRNAQRSVL